MMSDPDTAARPPPREEDEVLEEQDEDEGEEVEEEDEEEAAWRGDDAAGSDEELNLRMFGIQQALPVVGDPDWAMEEPDSAYEYLRRVRHERERCAAVVRADIDPALLQPRPVTGARAAPPAGQGATGGGDEQAPAPALPDAAWLQHFIRQFAALRQQLQQLRGSCDTGSQAQSAAAALPPLQDEAAWDALCFPPALPGGGPSAERAPGGEHAGAFDMQRLDERVYEVATTLDQVAVTALFQRHVDNLVDSDAGGGMAPARAQWLFALAACLEKPLLPDVAAALQALLRHCSAACAALGDAAHPAVPSLHVLMAVSGAYFGQSLELTRHCAGGDFQDLP